MCALLIRIIALSILQEKLGECYAFMEALIVDPLSSCSKLTSTRRHFKLPLSPNTVFFQNLTVHENAVIYRSLTDEDNSSVDYNSSRCNSVSSKADILEAVEECDSKPSKRQKRQ
jgi:hypothetical protein